MGLTPRTKCDLGVCRPWMCAFSQACPLGVWFGCLVLFWCCVKIFVIFYIVGSCWHMYGPDSTKCNLGVSRPGICPISPDM